jgi:ABC-type uncharacterized transport system ATPase component
MADQDGLEPGGDHKKGGALASLKKLPPWAFAVIGGLLLAAWVLARGRGSSGGGSVADSGQVATVTDPNGSMWAALQAAMLDRYPGELSGGQRQRVSLMRGLMLDPDVLLLDEPLGALYPMIRFDLQQDLKRIFQQLRKTVVLVTHDLGEAAFLGDVIVLMREGQIVQQGAARELVQQPRDAFVSRFVKAQRHSLDLTEPAS